MGLNLRIKERLVTTGRREEYLRAREIAREWGGLPSGVLLDEELNRKPRALELDKAWAREVIVYAGGGRVFQRGVRVMDSESKWILPPECIPEQAFERSNATLYFVPERIETEPRPVGTVKVVYVRPEKVTLVQRLIAVRGWGVADPVTRLPLDARGKSYDEVPETERRHMFMNRNISVVRPLSYNGNGAIFCDKMPEGRLEVVMVGRDLMDGERPLRLDICLGEILALAAGEDPESLNHLKPEELAAAKEVAKAYLQK